MKQQDLDGTFTYSDVEALDCQAAGEADVQVHPNPTADLVTILIRGTDEPVRFELTNAWGAVLERGTVTSRSTLSLARFEAGMYVLAIEAAGADPSRGRRCVRVMKQ